MGYAEDQAAAKRKAEQDEKVAAAFIARGQPGAAEPYAASAQRSIASVPQAQFYDPRSILQQNRQTAAAQLRAQAERARQNLATEKARPKAQRDKDDIDRYERIATRSDNLAADIESRGFDPNDNAFRKQLWQARYPDLKGNELARKALPFGSDERRQALQEIREAREEEQDEAPPTQTPRGPSGIKYSQPGSLTGGGITTSTGRGPPPGLEPGVYTTREGQQLIVYKGKKATTAAELAAKLPKSTADPNFQYRGPVVRVFEKSDPLLPNASTPYDTIITAIPTKETRASYLARTGQADFQTTEGNILKVRYTFDVNGRGDTPGASRSSGSDPSSFVGRLRKLPGAEGYLEARRKIVNNPRIIEVEQTLDEIYTTNVATIERFDARVQRLDVPFNLAPFVKSPALPFTLKLISAYPPKFVKGIITSSREVPETLPVAYGVGKVAGLAGEGATFLSSRYAVATASEPLLIRTSTAGIAKGVQATPYAIGAGLGTQTVLDFAEKSEGERVEYVGETAAVVSSFAAGDLSTRGQAVQAINKLYIKTSGAQEVPISAYVEPAVLRGDQRFSTIKAGDLQANRAAFEEAKFQVTHSTTADFPSQTFVQRGTSKQAGLYVTPKGKVSTYFLRLSNQEPVYSIGPAKAGTPQIVEARLSQYSEELIPIFKAEGPRSTKLSDEYLRNFGRPDTAYLESRSFYGQTPEVQAVIAEGTPLIQVGLETPGAKFFGFSKYVTTPEGVIVPVKLYQTGPGITPGPAGLRPAPLESEYASSKVYDPYRSSLALPKTESSSSASSDASSVTYVQTSSKVSQVQSPSAASSAAPSSAASSAASIESSTAPTPRSSRSVFSPPSSSVVSPPSQSFVPPPPVTSAPPSITPRPSSPIRIPEGLEPKYPRPKVITIQEPLYDVAIRRRGEFRRITTQGLRLEDAAKLAQSTADTSAAASFLILGHKTGQPVQGPERATLRKFLSPRFAPSKVDTNIFVEQTRFRINTPGEKAEIRPTFLKKKAIGGGLRL